MDESKPRNLTCRVCGCEFRQEWRARLCESKEVQHDRGVKAGEWVEIISGRHKGKLAQVQRARVMTAGYTWWMFGPYWHTVGLDVLVSPHGQDEFLTFDEYRTVAQAGVPRWGSWKVRGSR